jgi:hypothetical protein
MGWELVRLGDWRGGGAQRHLTPFNQYMRTVKVVCTEALFANRTTQYLSGQGCHDLDLTGSGSGTAGNTTVRECQEFLRIFYVFADRVQALFKWRRRVMMRTGAVD